MDEVKKAEFLRMLKKCMGAYSKPLPELEIIETWVELLTHYPLRVIGAAFVSYMAENDTFEPKPVAIANRCKLLDGRPGTEEAWALALTAQDEADTVVWTSEVAEALNIARPVLESSGPISARKTFIEAYERIVAKARLMHTPVQWVPSLGWDLTKRQAVLSSAVTAGLLPAPAAAALLPPPIGAAKDDVKAQEQIKNIREMLARMNEEKQQERELHEKREREAVAARKKELMDMAQKRLDEDLGRVKPE